MGIDIRLPVITAQTAEGQLVQMKSYLYQMAEQLKWAMDSIGTQMEGVVLQTKSAASAASEGRTPEATFNSIKSLIIKSADIVNAYYEEVTRRLEGDYEAISSFGTYKEETSQTITENSTAISQLFTNFQEISGTVNGIYDAQIETSAYIRHGLLEYGNDGAAVYGVEVGQQNIIDGRETFNKFARFTANRLEFYDAGNQDTPVAYISDYKLFITNAEITGTLTLGRYTIDTTDGLAFKWA